MCANFGRGPTVVSKGGAQTDKGTPQLYIVDTRRVPVQRAVERDEIPYP